MKGSNIRLFVMLLTAVVMAGSAIALLTLGPTVFKNDFPTKEVFCGPRSGVAVSIEGTKWSYRAEDPTVRLHDAWILPEGGGQDNWVYYYKWISSSEFNAVSEGHPVEETVEMGFPISVVLFTAHEGEAGIGQPSVCFFR